tara:strand:+ start:1401 stop:2549 length:1149 start_codon:yes stop_codon:yes gene_type:complete
MRVYEFNSLVNVNTDVKSTATYTRLPLGATRSYDGVAKEMHSTAPTRTDVSSSHRVQGGENLTGIVRDFLQAQGKNPSNSAIYDGVRKVAGANGLRNANLIHPGQDINLSVLLDRSAAVDTTPSAILVPLSSAPALTVTPLPAPVASLATSVPADPLRELALTQSEGPLKVVAALTPEAPSKTPVAAVADESDGENGVGGVPGERATRLQRLLNGTADALALVRDLMGEKNAPDELTTPSNPWQPILNGSARISSNYGMRKDPFTGRMSFHGGIDLAAKRGTEITAFRDGEVTFSGWKGGYGNMVVVRHEDGLESVYGHTAKNLVTVGDKVDAGTVIANVGSTGRSTGPHLHLEMRRHGKAINPMPHLEDHPVRLAQNESGN